MCRVLVIPDLHEPATHPAALQFVKDVKREYKCNRVVFIGDVLDWHSISFHASEPDAHGPTAEHAEAFKGVQRWYKAFPKATVTIGNHDERITRLASTVRIPAKFIKEYAEIWKTPGWNWVRDTTIDGVHYHHGTGLGGATPALNAARTAMVSTVVGHVHSVAGCHWAAGPDRRIFGMDVGCLADIEHPAMRYGRHLVKKPLLGCGVVIEGRQPHWIAMDLGSKKYKRGRYAKRKK
tara:strand:- start:741 stop:1448 length:708 start_codon:yes stop_codon:yes gene_type:complete